METPSPPYQVRGQALTLSQRERGFVWGEGILAGIDHVVEGGDVGRAGHVGGVGGRVYGIEGLGSRGVQLLLGQDAVFEEQVAQGR